MDKLPKSSIYAYKKTLSYKANKEYGFSNQLLPTNFFALMEKTLKEEGVIRTYKKYIDEFGRLENFFGVDKNLIVNALKGLLSERSQERYKSVETFKDLIRRYNSQYKGHYIKSYTKEKMDTLKAMSERKNKKIHDEKNKVAYSFKDFMNDMKNSNKAFIYEFNELLENASNVYVDYIYDDVIDILNDGGNLTSLSQMLGIYMPFNYDENYIKNNKTANRLKDNFEPLLNDEDNSLEYKKMLVTYINDLVEKDLTDN